MWFHVLACDFDGTLAHDGVVRESTIASLVRLRATGRKLVLVTGREIDDLERVFPRFALFDRIVAENGALLVRPESHVETVLAERPPQSFVDRLVARGVAPLSVGRAIVATWEPHQYVVLDTIKEMGLELQVIFNKGAVMILPTGVTKATGLSTALLELGISAHNAVGIGDAENDHALLTTCECGVAVANALPALRERADVVTAAGHGDGVVELIDRLVASDLAELQPTLVRHELAIGKREDGATVGVRAYGDNVLVAGTSGGGKSTFVRGVLERLDEAQYQYCIVDPEGDYGGLASAVAVGDPRRPPSIDEICAMLDKPRANAVASMTGIPLEKRPAFIESLLPRLLDLRARFGRPHWIVIDESHHVLPDSSAGAALTLPQETHGVVFVTVRPAAVSKAALELVDVVVAIGADPAHTLREFASRVGDDVPRLSPDGLATGEAIVWRRAQGAVPTKVRLEPPRTAGRRHHRKYAEGDLPPERSFFFRGSDGRLNLRVQNLALFLQIADGVDDDTWMFHLERHDYSEWLREKIGDPDLATQVESVESRPGSSAKDSRARIREAIERRYSAPA